MNFRQRRKFLWVLFLAGLVLIAIAASATTLSRLTLEDLAAKSTAIARLRCLGSYSRWDGGEIWTETKFEVVDPEEGSLSGTITVRTLGGRVGHLQSHVDEVPAFRPGEEVFLFLWNREAEPFRVLGWSQGTFRISRDARSGVETVTQDSAAHPVFDPQTRTFRHSGVRNMPLSLFRAKLRSVVLRVNP
jgi:hypothetical protein